MITVKEIEQAIVRPDRKNRQSDRMLMIYDIWRDLDDKEREQVAVWCTAVQAAFVVKADGRNVKGFGILATLELLAIRLELEGKRRVGRMPRRDLMLCKKYIQQGMRPRL